MADWFGLLGNFGDVAIANALAKVLHDWMLQVDDKHPEPITPDWFQNELLNGGGPGIAMAVIAKISESDRVKFKKKVGTRIEHWGPEHYWIMVKAPALNGKDTHPHMMRLKHAATFAEFCNCMDVFKAWFLA